MELTVDIETIPSQDPEIRQRLAKDIKPPGNYKKAKSIEEWERFQKPDLVEKRVLETSLNGEHGEVFAVGWAVTDPARQKVVNQGCLIREGVEEPEEDLLRSFWEAIRGKEVSLWVGHNVADFDIPFLWQRSVINQVRPTQMVPIHSPPWGGMVYDTMYEWAGRQKRISLANLCRALSIPYDETIDGSQVWSMVQDGRIGELEKYCTQDVRAVQAVRARLQFEHLPLGVESASA